MKTANAGIKGEYTVSQFEYLRNLFVQNRDMDVNDFPDEIIIDPEITMNQPIAHTRHGSPFDL